MIMTHYSHKITNICMMYLFQETSKLVKLFRDHLDHLVPLDLLELQV